MMLIEFLNKFNFKYKFKSSTDNYKNGVFNDPILRVIEKYDEIMNIILPTLRRKEENLLPLPICPDTGRVLEIPVWKYG